MELIENEFEHTLIQRLPPHARDAAELLFSTYSLRQMLDMFYHQGLPEALLEEFHLKSTQSLSILNACLLAKITYFLPNPKMTKEECAYLIRLGCQVAGYPLEKYKISEIIIAAKDDLPTFTQWLTVFEKLYLKSTH